MLTQVIEYLKSQGRGANDAIKIDNVVLRMNAQQSDLLKGVFDDLIQIRRTRDAADSEGGKSFTSELLFGELAALGEATDDETRESGRTVHDVFAGQESEIIEHFQEILSPSFNPLADADRAPLLIARLLLARGLIAECSHLSGRLLLAFDLAESKLIHAAMYEIMEHADYLKTKHDSTVSGGKGLGVRDEKVRFVVHELLSKVGPRDRAYMIRYPYSTQTREYFGKAFAADLEDKKGLLRARGIRRAPQKEMVAKAIKAIRYAEQGK